MKNIDPAELASLLAERDRLLRAAHASAGRDRDTQHAACERFWECEDRILGAIGDGPVAFPFGGRLFVVRGHVDVNNVPPPFPLAPIRDEGELFDFPADRLLIVGGSAR